MLPAQNVEPLSIKEAASLCPRTTSRPKRELSWREKNLKGRLAMRSGRVID
jgi:hypothetical protein